MSKNPACETGDHQLRRAVLSSFVGAALEWYDFFLYGAVAGLVFAPLYFPNFDPVVGTILSYATFAVGYIGRASGAVIFGHFGDKLGRKKVLVLTLYVMGIGTFAIGCIPTYDQIGIFAPLLLIICRFAQGLGLGGEWGGAILMSVESAPAHKRAFYGTLPQVGLAVGLLMASGVIGLLSLGMSDADFMAYGWRIAFISSIVLLAVGSYIRNKVGETKDFTEAKSSREEIGIPLLAAFTNYPKMMLAAIGARCFEGFVFAIFSVYSLTFLTQHGMDRSWSLIVVAVASAVMGVCMPFWGILADRIGKARTFGQNSLLLAFLTFLAFYIFYNYATSFVMACIGLSLTFGVVYSGMFGVMSSMFAECFPPAVRYSGMGFVYQISGIPSVGFAPMICIALVEWNGGAPWYLCTFTFAVGIISVISCWYMSSLQKRGYNKESSRREVPLRQGKETVPGQGQPGPLA